MGSTYGFAALGEFGEAFARRLLSQGRHVAIFDPNEHALARLALHGARVFETPREVADHAEVVFGAPSREAAIPLAQAIAKGEKARLYVNISTVGQPTLRALAQLFGPVRLRLVDAPFSGTPKEAAQGTLRLVMSGAPDDLRRVEKLAAGFAFRISKVGYLPGQAQICKLIGDALGLTALTASCEAVAVGTAAGIKSSVLVEIINAGTGRNTATGDQLPLDILPRTFASGELMSDALRKLDLYLHEASAVRIPDGVVAKTRELAGKAAGQLGAAPDATEIVKYFESFVGTRVTG